VKPNLRQIASQRMEQLPNAPGTKIWRNTRLVWLNNNANGLVWFEHVQTEKRHLQSVLIFPIGLQQSGQHLIAINRMSILKQAIIHERVCSPKQHRMICFSRFFTGQSTFSASNHLFLESWWVSEARTTQQAVLNFTKEYIHTPFNV
jgi:hypothetical protein